MTTTSRIASVRRRNPAGVVGVGLGAGLMVTYISLVLLIPLAALVWRAASGGRGSFWAGDHTP